MASGDEEGLTDHSDLADDELAARLLAHEVPPEVAWYLIAHRDDPDLASWIARALSQ
jgi:hypothetical protein